MSDSPLYNITCGPSTSHADGLFMYEYAVEVLTHRHIEKDGEISTFLLTAAPVLESIVKYRITGMISTRICNQNNTKIFN